VSQKKISKNENHIRLIDSLKKFITAKVSLIHHSFLLDVYYVFLLSCDFASHDYLLDPHK